MLYQDFITCGIVAHGDHCIPYESDPRSISDSWEVALGHTVVPREAPEESIRLDAETRFVVEYMLADVPRLRGLALLQIRIRVDGKDVANDCIQIDDRRNVLLTFTGQAPAGYCDVPSRALLTSQFNKLQELSDDESGLEELKRVGQIQIEFSKAIIDNKAYVGPSFAERAAVQTKREEEEWADEQKAGAEEILRSAAALAIERGIVKDSPRSNSKRSSLPQRLKSAIKNDTTTKRQQESIPIKKEAVEEQTKDLFDKESTPLADIPDGGASSAEPKLKFEDSDDVPMCNLEYIKKPKEEPVPCLDIILRKSIAPASSRTAQIYRMEPLAAFTFKYYALRILFLVH